MAYSTTLGDVPGNEVMFDDGSYPFRIIDHLYQEMKTSFSMRSCIWNLGNNGDHY